MPAYVHARSTRGRLYKEANGATARDRDTAAYTIYANREPHADLQRVVVSKLSDARESLAQAFQNAWRTVFSRNYRLYMTQTESYSQGFDPTITPNRGSSSRT